MTATTSYFEVDQRGLAQIMERRGKAFVVTELYQNARDENVSRVGIQLVPAGRGLTRVTVDDDSPDGWKDLRDAWTLFSPSYKKADPTKAGRFNLGEKLVLAVAREAEIITMQGTVKFGPEGRTTSPALPTRRGSIFTAVIPMTAVERTEAERLIRGLLVPDHIDLTLNGEAIPSRVPVVTFEASLETEIADAEGNLKPVTRKGVVNVYEPLEGERGTLYELGIPVVETRDRWHVSVEQKIPVSLDRTGLVTPGWLRDLRAEVLNHTADLLTADQAAEKWVAVALEDDRVQADAVKRVVTTRFGERSVIHDPSDPEANRIAAADGYAVIHGGTFSRKAWEHVREAEALRPAGQVTPSAKPFERDGDDLNEITLQARPALAPLLTYMERFAQAVLGFVPRIRFVENHDWPFRATYGIGSGLTWNLASAALVVGSEDLDHLLIHEYAHQYGSHLSEQYDRALSKLGAKAIAAVRAGDLPVTS